MAAHTWAFDSWAIAVSKATASTARPLRILGSTIQDFAYYDAMNRTVQNSSSTDLAELATVAEALRARRLVLLLGQNVVDAFVPQTSASIVRRLHIDDAQGLYEWWLTTTERFESRVSVLRELSDHAVLPESLISAARIPWSTVLTSVIDSVLRREGSFSNCSI